MMAQDDEKAKDQEETSISRQEFLDVLRKVTRTVWKEKPKKDDTDRLQRNWLP